jgi:hypothetical protein
MSNTLAGVHFLSRGEQVEQEGAQARLVQDVGDITAAGAVTAVPAAVGEHHNPDRLVRYAQMPAEAGRARADLNLFIPGGRVTRGCIPGRRVHPRPPH